MTWREACLILSGKVYKGDSNAALAYIESLGIDPYFVNWNGWEVWPL